MPPFNLTVYECKHQRGGAMLVMLVILVIGITTALISSLSNVGLRNIRDQETSEALARAKEALIGRAIRDGNLPGSLPCPDLMTNIPSNVPNDGVADLLSGDVCPSYIGRLPWKSLGISDLRDGAGERLWYALAPEFRDQTSPTAHSINSETSGSITLSGNAAANNLVAIVFAPGAPLPAQERSSANENTYSHFLESVVTLASSFKQESPDDHSGGNYLYNDQLISISHDDLMHSVEMRIAREARTCLEAYAADNGGKYPWAADVSNVYYPYSQSNILFGHFPEYQQPGTSVSNFIDSLSAFQNIVTACANGTGNSATLISTGSTLKDRADYLMDHQPSSPPMSTSITSPAKSAGDKAKDGDVTCSNIQADPITNPIQVLLDQTTSALSSLTADFSWPVGCTITQAAYWPYWKYQLFYQIDSDYKPGGAATAAGSIKINGIGNYRAAVALSRKALSTQVRNPTDITTYLEPPNTQLLSTDTDFETYLLNSNPLVNDLVLCLDGNTSTSCR